MGPAVFICVLLALIQSSAQYSLGKLSPDVMVSDGLSDDILTDSWNRVPQGCSSKPADVYLVLDTASGASPAALARQRTYLSQLAALFPLGKGGGGDDSRVGVVTFGFTPVLTSPLGQATSGPSLQEALRSAPRVGGSRRTAQALKYLRHTGFSPRLARQGVAHVVILLTNGHSSDAKQTAREAAALRQKGVIIYAVSVGGSSSSEGGQQVEVVDEGELKDLASRPAEDYVFFPGHGWAIVGSLMEVLRIRECNYQVQPPVSGKEPVCSSRRPTKLTFAVEHLGFGTPKTKKIITFIQDLLEEVDPDSPMQAAIITSRDPIARHALSKHVNTIEMLEQRLGGLVIPGLRQLLKRAGRELGRGGPADLQKVLVIFLDDSVRLTRKVLSAARALRDGKVDTYVVYVEGEGEGEEGGEGGERLGPEEVEKVASGPDHVIRVSGYDQLSHRGTVVATLRTVCRGL